MPPTNTLPHAATGAVEIVGARSLNSQVWRTFAGIVWLVMPVRARAAVAAGEGREHLAGQRVELQTALGGVGAAFAERVNAFGPQHELNVAFFLLPQKFAVLR